MKEYVTQCNTVALMCFSIYLSIYPGPSPELTTVTQWAGSYSSTSRTAAPSRTSTTGWRRPRATSSRTASSSCWSATSVTWRLSVRWPSRRQRSWQGPSGCATWRHLRETLSTWRRCGWDFYVHFRQSSSLTNLLVSESWPFSADGDAQLSWRWFSYQVGNSCYHICCNPTKLRFKNAILSVTCTLTYLYD